MTKPHPGVDPGHEPIVPGVAVGDLDGDGRLSVVATSTTGRTYVWDADGNRRAGLAATPSTTASQKPAIPRPDEDFTRPPIMGATATPVLADMNSDGALDVVQAGWDGAVHVWRPNGSNLHGWPITAADADPRPRARR